MRNQKGMSALKLILCIAVGIIVAGILGTIISFGVGVAALKGLSDALKPKTQTQIQKPIASYSQRYTPQKPIYQPQQSTEDKYDRIVREQFEKDNPNFKQKNQMPKIQWSNKPKQQFEKQSSEITRDDLIEYRRKQIAGQH